MAVLVVLPRETLCVVFARWNWALLRPLILMREHMRLQVLNMSSARRNRTQSLVGVFGGDGSVLWG